MKQILIFIFNLIRNTLFSIFCILVLGLGLTHCTNFDWNIDKATQYLTEHGEKKSRCWCAEYVMEAIWAGGKPIYLLPAFGYAYILEDLGFIPISSKNYSPKKGDIIVFPAIDNHVWGHIQMYNGKQWISDFKQSSMIPAKKYKLTNYKIFRYKKES